MENLCQSATFRGVWDLARLPSRCVRSTVFTLTLNSPNHQPSSAPVLKTSNRSPALTASIVFLRVGDCGCDPHRGLRRGGGVELEGEVEP